MAYFHLEEPTFSYMLNHKFFKESLRPSDIYRAEGLLDMLFFQDDQDFIATSAARYRYAYVLLPEEALYIDDKKVAFLAFGEYGAIYCIMEDLNAVYSINEDEQTAWDVSDIEEQFQDQPSINHLAEIVIERGEYGVLSAGASAAARFFSYANYQIIYANERLVLIDDQQREHIIYDTDEFHAFVGDAIKQRFIKREQWVKRHTRQEGDTWKKYEVEAVITRKSFVGSYTYTAQDIEQFFLQQTQEMIARDNEENDGPASTTGLTTSITTSDWEVNVKELPEKG